MGGRWGGDIKGRRGKGRRKEWQPPITKPRQNRDEAGIRAGALLAGIGFYILSLAGLLLMV